jgi:hypothetical protein
MQLVRSMQCQQVGGTTLTTKTLGVNGAEERHDQQKTRDRTVDKLVTKMVNRTTRSNGHGSQHQRPLPLNETGSPVTPEATFSATPCIEEPYWDLQRAIDITRHVSCDKWCLLRWTDASGCSVKTDIVFQSKCIVGVIDISWWKQR